MGYGLNRLETTLAYFIEAKTKDDIQWLIRLFEKATQPLTIYMDGVLYQFDSLESMDIFGSALEFYCANTGD